jgi:hypothetical protein
VIVNDRADMKRAITNRCDIEGDTSYSPLAEVDASVCCWPLDIIYVSEKAAGYDTGVSWLHAYNELESALNRARTCGGSEIWVAGGTYSPAEEEGTFSLLDGVELYGGFGGYESTLAQRQWVNHETVLSGDRDGDGVADIHNVVTASNLSDAVIDGFIIRDGDSTGIDCQSSELNVTNCRLTANGCGVDLSGSCVVVNSSMVSGNGWAGLSCQNSADLTVYRSIIRENEDGIFCWEPCGRVVVEDTCILGNYYNGIELANGSFRPVLRNSTIVGNAQYGVSGWKPDPQITSCIIRGNEEGSFDPAGDYIVNYSCIEGGWDGTGNIDADPLFIDEPEEAYDYHLSESSPCKDSGDENYTPSDPDETDIDGEARVTGGRVDMGADEYYRSAADFDGDEVVNFLDHAVFASAWLSSAGEGGYNGSCDLVEDETIDYGDFAVFCEDWLWEAGWTKSFGEGRGESMAMGGEPGGRIALPAAEQVEAEQVKEVDVEELLKLLGEVWLDEEVRRVIGEEEWAAFVEAVKAALLQDG